MATAQEVTLTSIIIIVQVVGISLNGIIVFFNFKRMKNEPVISSSTLIYFAMGLVNVFMQLQFILQNFLSVFYPYLLFMREVTLPVIILILIFVLYSFWLTGWLCAYYCVTIVNTGHQLIAVLRRILSSFLPHILLLTAVGSIFMSVLCIWMLDIVSKMEPQTNNTLETSFTEAKLLINPIYLAIGALLGSFLPFIIAVTSTGVTTFTLLRHITKMKHNVSGYNRPNIQTLISATRTMVLLLTSSTIFCVFELMFFAGDKKKSSDSITFIGWYVVLCFPSTQALIIIHAIPKLRKTILQKLFFRKEINNETYKT
ncbi:taste receptor type 2 member 4-like [Hyperolius riggenbachi]|uniref:taste receptor type 2 member 4-like n=1 Tax=Hyperolius riggenbachi TaxID=752182 RepID=UPI0035A33B88